MMRIFVPFTLIALLFLTSLAVHAAVLPVPANIHVIADDRAAVLTWDGDERAGTPLPQGVTGYLITWGDSAATQTVRTAYRRIELQPLTPNHSYTASVQAVDAFGTLSAASPPIAVMADSSRVDALRQQMTGFFDDFNLPQGAPDEQKWNAAFSGCNGPQSGFFINGQYHVHTMATTAGGNCDRGQTVVRPRAMFDFTGGGTLAFDFDGEQRRDQWYLDFVPSLMDIDGQVAIEAGDTHYAPGNMLRLHQNGQGLEIIWIDSTGHENSLASTNWQPYPPLDWHGLTLIPNVRRHWLIQLSQSKVTITIDGIEAISAPLTLPFSRAYVLFNQFTYNTPKSNEPYTTSHWDNFGFSGPASTTETHNYRADGYGTQVRQDKSGVAYSIAIPDSLVGATDARVIYTLQEAVNQYYAYNPNDHVIINGQTFPMPQPTGPSPNIEDTVSAINPYTQSITIPPTLLAQGTNTVQIVCAACGTIDVHTEIDFPANKTPAYTQPMAIMPPMIPPPPGAAIVSINGQWSGLSGTAAQNAAVHTLTGPFTLGVEATQDISMDAVGKNLGIASVALQMDHAVIWSQTLNGAPSYKAAFSFNDPANVASIDVPDGTHEFYFVAYDAQGRASYPDYFQADAQPGEYYPARIVSSGAKPKPTATATTLPPTTTPTVAPTDTAPPTDTATPEPTATAVATDTLAPTMTDTPLPTATSTPPVTTRPIGVRICFTATGQCSYWPGIQVGDVSVESYP